MTITRMAAAVAIVVGSWSSVGVTPAAADQETLARAKALYTAAAYDEALALLNQFESGALTDALEVNQYRAFCLLALGRSDDARKVIQEIVEANPTFQPPKTQVSPRLLDAFREVRQRTLPAIVRKSYGEGKAAFDRKEFDVAKSRFDLVVALLDDGDAKGSEELADLRILSNGFLDLMKTAAAAPAAAPSAPPAAAPAAAPSAPSAAAPAAAQEAAAPDPSSPPPSWSSAARAVYDVSNADVTPPVAISQTVPPWYPTRQQIGKYDASLLLTIDERGTVTSVTLQGNLHPNYAVALRHAASRWTYQPATRNGVPVKYRKVVGIHLTPQD
jgi:tetratricopeptide (TPR) repeat protein